MKNQNAQFKKLIKSHMKWQKEDLAGKVRGMFFRWKEGRIEGDFYCTGRRGLSYDSVGV